MKTLKLILLGGIVVLLTNCSGGTGSDVEQSDSQQEEAQPEPQEKEEETVSPELTQKLETGKAVYTQYCLVCHQADGAGVTGAFPPLKESDWVSGDNTRLISVILNGMEGPIEVNGVQYNSVMPQHGFLSDDQIAAVLTYVRKSFGNNAQEINAEEVAEVRDKIQADTTAN